MASCPCSTWSCPAACGGGAAGLRWDDLNVKDRILSVSKQVTRIDGELVVTEPKTKNSVRKVALSQQAVDYAGAGA